MDYSEIAQLKIKSDEAEKYKDFKIKIQPSKITSNFIKLVFLDLMIYDGEAYGAQVKELFDDVLPQPQFISMSNGNLYPVIRELRENGIIEYSDNESHHPKYYRITEKGKEFYNLLKKELKLEVIDSIKFYKAIKKLVYRE